MSFGVELMTFPLTFVGEIRNKFDEIKIEAKTFCEGENISNIFFKEQRRTIFDETGERETILKGKDERFRIEVFNVICDNITQDLSKRVECYKEVASVFRCFFYSR